MLKVALRSRHTENHAFLQSTIILYSAEYSNCRKIALLHHLCKVLIVVLLGWLRSQVEAHSAEVQAGFRRDCSTIRQTLILMLIGEKQRKNMVLYDYFIDFH